MAGAVVVPACAASDSAGVWWSSQIALALVLVAAAGLLIQSFARMRGVDPGFVPEHLLTARVELSPVRYEDQRRSPRASIDGWSSGSKRCPACARRQR